MSRDYIYFITLFPKKIYSRKTCPIKYLRTKENLMLGKKL